MPSDLQAAVSGTTSDLSDLLDELVVLQLRLTSGVAYCRNYADTSNYDKGYRRLLCILTRNYLPALATLRSSYGIERLTTERDALNGRLETGWDREDSDAVQRTFERLLGRYEVLCDAVDGNVINRYLGRAERLTP